MALVQRSYGPKKTRPLPTPPPHGPLLPLLNAERPMLRPIIPQLHSQYTDTVAIRSQFLSVRFDLRRIGLMRPRHQTACLAGARPTQIAPLLRRKTLPSLRQPRTSLKCLPFRLSASQLQHSETQPVVFWVVGTWLYRPNYPRCFTPVVSFRHRYPY